jgi:hypothetical protein
MYHLALGELHRRGEDIRCELGRVLALLTADLDQKRLHGWVILTRLYPDLAARIPDYDPGEATETCRAKVRSLTDAA